MAVNFCFGAIVNLAVDFSCRLMVYCSQIVEIIAFLEKASVVSCAWLQIKRKWVYSKMEHQSNPSCWGNNGTNLYEKDHFNKKKSSTCTNVPRFLMINIVQIFSEVMMLLMFLLEILDNFTLVCNLKITAIWAALPTSLQLNSNQLMTSVTLL